MPFDLGIIILGLGGIALLAGLGAWVWECVQGRKPESSEKNLGSPEAVILRPPDRSSTALKKPAPPIVSTAVGSIEIPRPPQQPKNKSPKPEFKLSSADAKKFSEPEIRPGYCQNHPNVRAMPDGSGLCYECNR